MVSVISAKVEWGANGFHHETLCIENSDNTVVSLALVRWPYDSYVKFMTENLGYQSGGLPHDTSEIIGREYAIPCGVPRVPKWEVDPSNPCRVGFLDAGVFVVSATCDNQDDATLVMRSVNGQRRKWYWNHTNK